MSPSSKKNYGSATVLAIASLLFGWLVVAGLAFFGDDLLRLYIVRPAPPVATPQEYNSESTRLPSLSVTASAPPVIAPVEITPTVIAPPPLRMEAGISYSDSFLTSAGVITWTNLNREQNGLPPLQQHRLLDQAAQLKLDDMFARQYFAHESPSGDGPAEVITGAGFVYLTVGENLALGDFEGDEDLVNGWMNSPGHRANILRQTFTHIGVAVGKGLYEGRETWMAVQEFGVPKSVCSEPEASLRQTIDGLDADLALRQNVLDQRHAEIQTMDPREDPDGYNAKADEFNRLVAEFNMLVVEQKAVAGLYNEQANAFNACVAGYTF